VQLSSRDDLVPGDLLCCGVARRRLLQAPKKNRLEMSLFVPLGLLFALWLLGQVGYTRCLETRLATGKNLECHGILRGPFFTSR
jgi:hypothetical protein